MEGITVFTPTYNREHSLRRAYESLVKQDFSDFEWLIIDDGSTDKTQQLVEEFIDDNIIRIRYIKQDNYGKYIAHNIAVMYAAYDIFLTLDSDDYLLEGALNIVSQIWKERKIACNERCAGLLTPLEEQGTSDICVKRSSLIGLYKKHGFKGEAAVIWKTSVISRFPMPKIENERFLVESVYMRRIDDVYYYECVNIRLEHRQYYDDGLTANIKKITDTSPMSELYALKNDAVYTPLLWDKSTQYLKFLIKAKEYKIKYLFPEMRVDKIICFLTYLRIVYRKLIHKTDSDIL